jgi:hypothetical protein
MPLGSISPFCPTGTVTLLANAQSANVALSGGGDSIVVTNTSNNLVHIRFGSDSTLVASLSDMPVLAGSRLILSINNLVTHAAAISPSGSGTVLLSRGEGSVI